MFSKNDLPMKSASRASLALGQLRQFNNYELTMMTPKGETFAGSKIQRETVFYFVIDVAGVILLMCIGLLRQRTK